MNERPDRLCYNWECMKYPKCARAAGSGCSLDWVDEEDMKNQRKTVLPCECGEENGYPLFEKKN